MVSWLPYLLGGAVLVWMVAMAALDDHCRRHERSDRRKALQRSITDLECWLEIADRKSAAEADRELKVRAQRSPWAEALKEQWADVDLRKQLYADEISKHEARQVKRLVDEGYFTQEQMDAHKPIRRPLALQAQLDAEARQNLMRATYFGDV